MESDPLPKDVEAIASATGTQKAKNYITYCENLIALQEKGELSEEEVGYSIVATTLQTKIGSEFPILDAIFDAAADLEIPRDHPHRIPFGSWDEKLAESLIQEDWQKLRAAIGEAKLEFCPLL